MVPIRTTLESSRRRITSSTWARSPSIGARTASSEGARGRRFDKSLTLREYFWYYSEFRRAKFILVRRFHKRNGVHNVRGHKNRRQAVSRCPRRKNQNRTDTGRRWRSDCPRSGIDGLGRRRREAR